MLQIESNVAECQQKIQEKLKIVTGALDEAVEIKNLHLKIADKYKQYMAYKACKAQATRELELLTPNYPLQKQQHTLMLPNRPTAE